MLTSCKFALLMIRYMQPTNACIFHHTRSRMINRPPIQSFCSFGSCRRCFCSMLKRMTEFVPCSTSGVLVQLRCVSWTTVDGCKLVLSVVVKEYHRHSEAYERQYMAQITWRIYVSMSCVESLNTSLELWCFYCWQYLGNVKLQLEVALETERRSNQELQKKVHQLRTSTAESS